MKEKLKEYIRINYVQEKKANNSLKFKKLFNAEEIDYSSYKTSNIEEFVNQKDQYNNFQSLLFKMIDDRNLKDSDVYKKVNIDTRLFSKIRSDNNYHPSKETVILLGLSLELKEKEFEKLLNSAAYSLPKNNYFDLIIRFCIINNIYKIPDVYDLLMDYNCKLLNN